MSVMLNKNDYRTALVLEAKNDDQVIPLFGAKVIFHFVSKQKNERIGGGECEIFKAKEGLAKYKFQEGELQVVGKYQGKFSIEFPQGARRDSIALDFEIIEKETADAN